jgi:hypothetical protein
MQYQLDSNWNEVSVLGAPKPNVVYGNFPHCIVPPSHLCPVFVQLRTAQLGLELLASSRSNQGADAAH